MFVRINTITMVASKCLNRNQRSIFLQQPYLCFSTNIDKPEIPKNPLRDVFSANAQKENGIIYDKKPFRLKLEAGRKYSWCLCGRSKTQPLCDGTHKDIFLKVKQRPIHFTVETTKEYWLCNCKQTRNRPFCDGAHKQQAVQEATSVKV